MKKIDRRVLRTRQSLGDALVNLTLSIGYDAITIKELTQEAGIGYATFFRHFKSKDELLMYVLESVLEDLGERLEANMTPYEQALVMYQYIQENERTYRVIVNLPRDSELIHTIYETTGSTIRDSYTVRDENEIPMDVAVNHIVTSIIELIRWWINQDLELSAEQMATIHHQLIVKATELVALDPVDDQIMNAVVG